MGKVKEKLYMKLDTFKKTSSHPAPKKRNMSMLSKILIFYRFGRFNKGLILVLFLAYLIFMGMHKAPELDLAVVIVFYGIISALALPILISGFRRMANTISIIEYGTQADATVSSLKEWTTRRSVWAGIGTIGHAVFYTKHKRGRIICSFSDDSGKKRSVDVFFHNDEDQIKKGDNISVVYDPGMPENAIAVNALPKLVKTDPAL